MRAGLSFCVGLMGMSSLAWANPDPGQIEVILAQSFTLEQPYTYTFAKPPREISKGTIVVINVHPDDAHVTQVASSVLYIGDIPAERVNNGDKDGRIIAFAPAHLDMSQTPVFWGPMTLPEQVDQAAGTAALAFAPTATPASVDTSPTIEVRDASALYKRLADLIDQYAPSEQERARGYRGH